MTKKGLIVHEDQNVDKERTIIPASNYKSFKTFSNTIESNPAETLLFGLLKWLCLKGELNVQWQSAHYQINDLQHTL